jgi:hypothetical protein
MPATFFRRRHFLFAVFGFSVAKGRREFVHMLHIVLRARELIGNIVLIIKDNACIFCDLMVY